MAHEILSEMRGNALIVTFNRVMRSNKMNIDMANMLFQILKPVATERTIRAVMLRGAGDEFMTGVDPSMYERDVPAGIEKHNEMLLPYHSAIRELHAMDKPVLAVAKGHISGPGLSFIAASDLVVAGKSTLFNAGFTSYALSPDGGVSYFLPRKIGAAKAAELLMLSEDFDASTAEKLGLVNQVVDDSELEEAAFRWIDKLANGPTKAFGAVKRLIGRSFEHDLNAHIGLEHAYWGGNVRSFDFRSAIKASLTKQPVKFTGA